jgi:uncharacterized protein YciI
VKFDQYVVTLLVLRPDAPVLPEAQANDLQDRHLHHGAVLQEQGIILARGPLREDPSLRGFSVWSVDADRARELAGQDPAVIEGRFEVRVLTWMVPAGNVSFNDVRVPHSIADVMGD